MNSKATIDPRTGLSDAAAAEIARRWLEHNAGAFSRAGFLELTAAGDVRRWTAKLEHGRKPRPEETARFLVDLESMSVFRRFGIVWRAAQ